MSSWITRINRKELLPVPELTRRYFLSFDDASAICSQVGTNTETFGIHVPDPTLMVEQDLLSILIKVLDYFGYNYEFIFESEEADKKKTRQNHIFQILLTKLDTVGEKQGESFLSSMETESKKSPIKNMLLLDSISRSKNEVHDKIGRAHV